MNYFSFNNPSEPKFVGYCTDVTGLDDSEVRESANLVPGGWGGRHHKFFAGRRPFTITGLIMPTTPASARLAAQDSIMGIMNRCMLTSGTLRWQPSDGILRWINFRKQLAIRITKGQGNVDKTFMIAGVAASPTVLSGAGYNLLAYAPTLTLSAPNIGTADAAVKFTIHGPITNPIITNNTSGKLISFAAPGLTLTAIQTLTLDLTQTYPYSYINGAGNFNGYVDATVSDWTIGVQAQRYNNGTPDVFTLTGTGMTSGVTNFGMQYYDSWA